VASVDGVLIVDKPAGPTSHDVVACVRRATGWLKVGHTGTLDPLATGVLPLVVGRATRLAQFLSAADKVYEAEVRLGWATNTYDAEGTPMDLTGLTPRAADDLEAVLDRFRGSYLQVAPPFSAKKTGGVRAYSLARKGVPAAPRQSPVTVYELSCIERGDERLRLRLRCSAGFYVRAFAHELGIALGVGGHLSALRRTKSGDFDAAEAVALGTVLAEGQAAASRLVPLERLLASMPAVVVTAAGVARALHGNQLRTEDVRALPEATAAWVRVVDEDGALLAIAEPSGKGGFLHPRVVVR